MGTEWTVLDPAGGVSEDVTEGERRFLGALADAVEARGVAVLALLRYGDAVAIRCRRDDKAYEMPVSLEACEACVEVGPLVEFISEMIVRGFDRADREHRQEDETCTRRRSTEWN